MEPRKPLTFHLNCDEPWFSLIRDGIKPVEGRKNSPKYQPIQAGDFIDFSNGDEHFMTIVTEIRRYSSVEEYLEDVTITKALPGVPSFTEAVKTYHLWNTPEEIQKHGFLGIFVKIA